MSFSKDSSRGFKLPNQVKFLFKNININVNIPNHNFITHNVFVLYFLLFISLIYLLVLIIQKNFTSISIFILTGFLTSFFSHNMIIIFLTSLIFTIIHQYIKIYCKSINGFEGFEGFEGVEGVDDEATDENIENENENENEEDEEEEGKEEDKELEKRENGEKAENMENKQDTNDSDNVNELEKIQEQTKILLDTHNELIKNIESLKPYLKEANDSTKSLSKIMNGSLTENFK